ncbi:phage antirepressor Ant [Clostridium botulinum]|nr:phage antirepressor Ant [Clostridium botulinum]NFP02192.1 phage antirepressor Ant [Clostridium botulinum]
MNNEIKVFSNNQFGQIRAFLLNDKPHFIGKDVAAALGYCDPKSAVSNHVDKEDKRIIQKRQITTLEIPNRGLTVINESGLYSLILSSKLQCAKKFKRWVTSEVLPSIRKSGGYIKIDDNMSDKEIMAKALMVAQNTIHKKNTLLKIKGEEIEKKHRKLVNTKRDLDMKNKFINQIAVSENSLLVREVAKVASKNGAIIGEKRLWNKLRKWGFIFKNSTEAKQEGIERGYFEIVEGSVTNREKTFIYKTTRVTGKGQVYIINRLLKEQEQL